MPIIRPSSDLRNNYNEISTICHETQKPVYITKNGAGDLAVMSIEAYEKLIDAFELYVELEKGLDDVRNGRTQSAEEVFEEINKIFENEKEEWGID